MTSSRRVHRLYAFELVTVVNFLIVLLFAGRQFAIVATMSSAMTQAALVLVGQLAIGVVVRSAFLAARGQARGYWRVLSRGGWWIDTARLLLMGALMLHVYGWIKLLVPVYHPRLFDVELWELDRRLFLGYSPNVFFLNLFSAPKALRFADWSYAKVFVASMTIAFAFFLSYPGRRLRTAFMTGNVVLWIAGAWLYMLVPSLGPAFRFPEVWLPYGREMPITHYSQVALMLNYQAVLKVAGGAVLPIVIIFGIAAFPSLHVGFQTYAFLWTRKVWHRGQVIFGTFLLLIFLGSMILGWHYLVDAIAGLILAWICFAIPARRLRIERWLHLRDSLKVARPGTSEAG